ncbi:MAG: CvpA family protein [Xanthomonadales bacterium]|nr:CvpA family protein [Xanthomonadales bacterium]
MSAADWLIVLAIATSVAIGLIRGLVVELMALVVWALAVLAAATLAPQLSDALAAAIDTPSARIFLAYALVFVGTLLLGALVTWMMRKLVAGTGLSGTDRLLGGVFGIARGVVVVVLAVLVLGLTPAPRDAWWRASRLLPHAVVLAERVRARLPERIAAQVRFDGSEAPGLLSPETDAAPRRSDELSRI